MTNTAKKARHETDLGPATEAIVKHIDRFNPGDIWEVVAD
ncbi:MULTISPECIES: DUF2950 family protein [Mesorhizobium]|nr:MULTISPECIES: DUF2950 family protein [Mesorhizobium]MCF6119796.1 DUF2950 domain-containing protein [Mesorhizobium muleiense]TIL49285.1 MAG: DUF2950 domain-containing protein [Mesorhizobium sp.]TIL58914.1 MAG: DUF2950 domain-containing protein [Mesorhizobium sp.]TIM44006.1 MAG: DUF2950 domain-containing protein [Mesorhizobium sp.]